MTQGGPSRYESRTGIGIVTLIKNLKRDIPDITQPWYADDARALGYVSEELRHILIL